MHDPVLAVARLGGAWAVTFDRSAPPVAGDCCEDKLCVGYWRVCIGERKDVLHRECTSGPKPDSVHIWSFWSKKAWSSVEINNGSIVPAYLLAIRQAFWPSETLREFGKVGSLSFLTLTIRMHLRTEQLNLCRAGDG